MEFNDFQITEVNISSNEILNLNSSPKEIIAAPGAGKYIHVVKGYIFYDYGTVAYSVSGSIRLEYESEVNQGSFNNLIDQTTNRIAIVGGVNVIGDLQDVENQALQLTALNADPMDGDGTIKVKLIYVVLDL